MRRLSEQTLWYLTSLTLLALLIVAVATTRAMSRYNESTFWLSHTHHVSNAVETIRADLYFAQNSCLRYVFAGQPESLRQFEEAANALPERLGELRQLTADNPLQQSEVAALEPLLNQEITFLRTSAAMKDKGGSAELLQEFSNNGKNISQQIFLHLSALRQEEQRLLGLRTIISDKTYATQKLVLSISFVVVLLFAVLNFRELMAQLRQRQNAEQVVRRLSGRLLQAQDEERRKIARDLHDGIGQIFAALKMELNQLARSDSRSQQDAAILSSSVALVDEGLKQSRTISYLLHPPMLDEVGFAAAAKWLVHGFSQRSKIAVSLEIPEDLKLPKELELTLFRVLQESLTNVHRHSGSSKADVVVASSAHRVTMTVADYGKGIPTATVEDFRSSKSPSGVGLAGMRARVADMDGRLDVQSAGQGTLVRVTIPVTGGSQTAPSPPAPPASDAPQIPGSQRKAKGKGASFSVDSVP
jgi:signal transduction histidine kinase